MSPDDWYECGWIILFVIVLVMAGVFHIGEKNREAKWLDQAPVGSHLEYYPTGSSSESSHSPKIVFPDHRVWYPDLEPITNAH